MTRGSFSTIVCHNGGDGLRQREQGYHVSSVRASNTRWPFFVGGRRTDGWVFFRGAGISSAIYVVSRSTSFASA